MLLLVFSMFTSLPAGYGKSLCYACFLFHVEPHLLAPPEVSNNCTPTEQKRLLCDIRPFLLLRKVWLARLGKSFYILIVRWKNYIFYFDFSKWSYKCSMVFKLLSFLYINLWMTQPGHALAIIVKMFKGEFINFV